MSLPAFVPDLDPHIRAAIAFALPEIAQAEGVRILFAVESGSRAWGFPSPDSDYDVRFVYAHAPDWYLSLAPGRDVIERPISDALDISGWDLRKALNLLLKPNPVLLEWLSSPIRYAWGPDADRLADLSRRVSASVACLHHYLHLGEGQWRRHIGTEAEIRHKKLFYALRPALAIRWLRLRPGSIPPMNLHALCAGVDLDAAAEAEIARLLVLKARSREIGTGPRIPVLDRLIAEEFDWARRQPSRRPGTDLRAEAEALFRAIVRGEA